MPYRRRRRGAVQIFGELDSIVSALKEASSFLRSGQYVQVNELLMDVMPRVEDLRLHFRDRIAPTFSELPSRVKEIPQVWRNGVWVFIFDGDNKLIRRKLVSKEISVIDQGLNMDLGDFTVERPAADIETKHIVVKAGDQVLYENQRLPKKTGAVRIGVIEEGELRFLER